ncbi:MAG: ion transporter, partial [Bacteroidales bacterium]|nr:ion transporter [Bacteroidales bacterium]
MTKIEKFRGELNNVFDDNLHTKQWHNIVDYLIIGFILISTLEVFLSTYVGLMERYGHWLHIVDYTTTAFFTVEVILRIWTADLLKPKYKGFWGRVRYCFSFYGMIDIISTFPFYLNLFMNIPYVALKAFRIARLLRIFRYMKAFSILSRAMSSKKQEMVVSLQFLTIVTLILSFVLFFVEHEAQPDVYNNGFVSVVWAFAQYIGDPGGFAETPPVTFIGRIIACIIGVLGIALFAVPAGLVGAGFTDAMKEEEHGKEVKENIEKLHRAFERKLDRPTGFQIVPQYLSICDIQTRMGMKTDEIFDAVEASDNFRLINLATTQPVNEHPQDKLAIEHFPINRSYGCCINRNSKITIVSPSSLADAAIGHFSYYLAKIGGFNYISRELGELRPYRSYYTFS